MERAIFINGGAGRVLCAIPALEKYVIKNKNTIIVAESFLELYMSSPILRDKVFSNEHKNLFELIKDKECITPEPYRLNAYFNQKVNLIQAFDMIINGLTKIPETAEFDLDISKSNYVNGYKLCKEAKKIFQKEKVIVFQPFGSGVKSEENIVYDDTGRSVEIQNVIKLIKELSKDYAIIIMSQTQIPVNEPLNAIIPDNVGLLQWNGVIKCADYFLGCDSIGQHIANALNKPSTVMVGSTFPENISYPGNPNFNVVDIGKEKRIYSPIRITGDYVAELNNEDLMYMEDEQIDSIVQHIKSVLGTSEHKCTGSCKTHKKDKVIEAEVEVTETKEKGK